MVFSQVLFLPSHTHTKLINKQQSGNAHQSRDVVAGSRGTRRALVVWLVEDVRETALAAVLSIEVRRHEDTCSALLVRTLATQTRDLAVLVDLKQKHKNTLQLSQRYLDIGESRRLYSPCST